MGTIFTLPPKPHQPQIHTQTLDRYTYKLPPGYIHGTEPAQSLLAGSYQFKPDEVEVFYETNYK